MFFASAFRSSKTLTFIILIIAIFRGFTPVSAQTMVTGAQIRNPLTPVSTLPSTCTPYSVFFLTTTKTPYICTAPNTFTPFSTSAPGGGTGLPSLSGKPAYIYTDGTSIFWGNIVAGGSGALDCTTAPGQCDIVTAIVPLKNSANVWTGANDFSSGLLRIPESTIAGLPPAASNTGREFMVTDGASNCDTSQGGGSIRVLVASNGTAYVAPNCSNGAGATGDGSMIYPATGVPYSFGNGWGASYSVGTAANNLVQLDSSGKLPAVDGSRLTNLPSGSGSGSGSGLPIYDASGNILTGSPHIVRFSTALVAYTGATGVPLNGSAVFTSAPDCAVTNTDTNVTYALYYCKTTNTQCTHASTGSTLYFQTYGGGTNANIDVICVGN